MKKKLFYILLILVILINSYGCKNADKTINRVTIAGYGLDDETLQYINLCQKSNPEIKIEIKDYQKYGKTDEAIKQLKIDLNTGNCGDLFISSNYFYLSDYFDYSISRNLNEFQEINEIKDKMLPNILQSIETNGEIYEIYPFYTINCFAAKKNVINSEQWNRKGILDILNRAVDNDTNLFGNNSDTKLQSLIISEICHDYDEGKSLDKNWYSKLIEASIQLSKLEKNSIVDYSDELIFKNNQVICREANIDSFENYYYLKKAYFDDDISLLGDAYDKNTVLINPEIKLSILSNSLNKNSALKIITYFMSEEFQKIVACSNAFPVFINEFNAMYNNTLQENIYDENGNVLEKKDGMYIVNGNEIKFDLPVKRDLEEIYSLLTSVNKLKKQNYNLRKEILSEISYSFDSDKEPEQIFDDINNIYNTYVSENQK
ncbi:hypothetical protein [Ruminococcus sp.]|uniref:hypothetical protein n=1 Tax=Ruminococcus sp. TaxID=41978 RepID=UPI0025F3D4A0|nr:hypothetical protein [Ruminococcus sp.]